HPPTTGEEVDDDHWTVRVPVEFRLYDDKPAAYGQWEAYLPGPRTTAAWAQDDVSPDAIAAGGLQPVGGGLKLLTPLRKGCAGTEKPGGSWAFLGLVGAASAAGSS